VKVHTNSLARFDEFIMDVHGLDTMGQRGISFNGSTTYISRGQDWIHYWTGWLCCGWFSWIVRRKSRW